MRVFGVAAGLFAPRRHPRAGQFLEKGFLLGSIQGAKITDSTSTPHAYRPIWIPRDEVVACRRTQLNKDLFSIHRPSKIDRNSLSRQQNLVAQSTHETRGVFSIHASIRVPISELSRSFFCRGVLHTPPLHFAGVRRPAKGRNWFL